MIRALGVLLFSFFAACSDSEDRLTPAREAIAEALTLADLAGRFEVIDGSLTGDDHLRLMTANPTRADGYFFDAFHKNRDLWKCHTFNAEESERAI